MDNLQWDVANDRTVPYSLEKVESRLAGQLGSRIRDLRISLDGAGLILEGHTQTYYGKQLAQHAAGCMTGRRIVANDIKVAFEAG